MRSSIGLARLPLFLTLVAAVLVLVLSDRTGLILRVYLLALAAVALAHLVRLVRGALPRRPGRRSRRACAGARATPSGCRTERVEREVSLGLATAFDLHPPPPFSTPNGSRAARLAARDRPRRKPGSGPARARRPDLGARATRPRAAA